MKINKITVRVELDSGDIAEFAANDPPFGGNPAFMNRQLSAVWPDLEARLQKWLGIFAKQYTEADERLDRLKMGINNKEDSDGRTRN